MNNPNHNQKDHYAKIEVEIAGDRYVGEINLNDIPAAAVKLYRARAEMPYEGTDKKILAIDFDGTLFSDAYPEIGDPINIAIECFKTIRAAGHKLILWTCRCDAYLDAAVAACKAYGLEFDAINDNLQSNKDKYGNDSRKVFANIYVDEKSVNLEAIMGVCKGVNA